MANGGGAEAGPSGAVGATRACTRARRRPTCGACGDGPDCDGVGAIGAVSAAVRRWSAVHQTTGLRIEGLFIGLFLACVALV